MRALVEARRRELELELVEVQKSAPERSANIEAALAALKALLTGNLDQIPPVLAQELSQWIETSKYLGPKKPVEAPPVPAKMGPELPKTGLNLRALVEARHRENQVQIVEIKRGAPGKIAEIEIAVAALKALLTGELDQIPPPVALELGKWIETSEAMGAKPRPVAKE